MKSEDLLYKEALLAVGQYKSYFLTETEYSSIREGKLSNKKSNKRIFKIMSDLEKSAQNLESQLSENLDDDVKNEVRLRLSEFSMFIMKLREFPSLIG